MKTAINFLLLFALVSCNTNHNGFKITGLTSGFPDSTKIYLIESETSKICDSALVLKNQFHFKGHTDSLKNYTIHTKNFRDYKMFWIDNSAILINSQHSTLRNARVSGSEFQNLNSQYLDLENLWRRRADSIIQNIRQTDKADSISLKKLLAARDSVVLNQQKALLEFMQSNPDFYLNSYYLTYLMISQSKDATEKMYSSFSENVKNNKWGRAVKVFIDNSVDLKIGDNAVDFTLPDIEGNQIALSSLHEKYVLLEFWASWCGPCRAENPFLLKMYRKYRSDGFEILGVSLDEQKEEWQSTIKSDSIIWKTVSDLKGQLGKVPLTYKVNGIPMSYLIDPAGKIIDIDIRDVSLGNKLAKIFKH